MFEMGGWDSLRYVYGVALHFVCLKLDLKVQPYFLHVAGLSGKGGVCITYRLDEQKQIVPKKG